MAVAREGKRLRKGWAKALAGVSTDVRTHWRSHQILVQGLLVQQQDRGP
jgi:hypothetical protein